MGGVDGCPGLPLPISSALSYFPHPSPHLHLNVTEGVVHPSTGAKGPPWCCPFGPVRCFPLCHNFIQCSIIFIRSTWTHTHKVSPSGSRVPDAVSFCNDVHVCPPEIWSPEACAAGCRAVPCLLHFLVRVSAQLPHSASRCTALLHSEDICSWS